MTNKEQTISNLKKLKSFHNGSYGADIDRAIRAIEQEPCEDAISRQAVEEIINDIRDCISVEGYWAILERLKKLPPVTPQPKTGHWIEHEIECTLKWLECSNCHCETSYNIMHNYCPNCGAKMVEPQESEDE